jgi:hypothetical protein
MFQFAKGFLATATTDQVDNVIGEVFSTDNGGGQQGQDSQQQGQQGQLAQQQAPPQQAPPAQPQTVELGQTADQVQAALGPPDKVISLGAKQIYVYKDSRSRL